MDWENNFPYTYSTQENREVLQIREETCPRRKTNWRN